MVCNSFGKDSVVLMELVKMAGVKCFPVHSFTGIDPPEAIKFGLKTYPDTRIYRPVMSMWEGIRAKFPPVFNKRWCCDVLKKDPTKAIPLKHKLVGIRAEESPGRKERGRISRFRGKWQYSPIFEWHEWHVWEFIEGLGLPFCELYDQGFDRIG